MYDAVIPSGYVTCRVYLPAVALRLLPATGCYHLVVSPPSRAGWARRTSGPVARDVFKQFLDESLNHDNARRPTTHGLRAR